MALLITVVCAAALVDGCGSSGRKSAPPPLWVQRANAFCKVQDKTIKSTDANFDSAAEIAELEHEGGGLARLGVFNRIPAAGKDVLQALGLLVHSNSDDFSNLKKADRDLIGAGRAAAREGVHCSFAAFPLVNL